MQQHRVYVDDWTLLEKICLVSAVQRFGENWTSICEFIKPKLQEERQWDWFTAETCEAQYRQLYNENVKPLISSENPLQQIVRSLKSRCRIEGQPLEEQKNKYLTLKKILETVAKNEIGEDQLDKYYDKALQAKKDKEESRRKYQELLKKRDIAKAEYEKIDTTKSPSKTDSKSDASSPVTTSPLLSSLLNNPPAVQYRPTLSTSSFVQTKVPQNQSSSPGRQSNIFSGTSSTARRLSFQEIIGSPTSDSRSTPTRELRTPKETTPVPELPPKTDAQNLENLVLISPNEEYLSEVDIPPETLLEVIDNLKEGTLSLDKIIRDLEAGGDDNIILNKDDLVSVGVEETYVETPENMKPTEAVVEQPCPEIITISDENSISPKTASVAVDENLIQSDRIVNHPTSEKSSTIVTSLDDISVPSMNSVECESSASELSTVSVSIEGVESAETNVDAEITSNRNSPSVESVKQTVQFSEAKSNVSQIQEVDVGAEDSRLSAEGYVSCESISEASEMIESIADEQEPPVLSKVGAEELESRDEVGTVNEETVGVDEVAGESVEVAVSEEPAVVAIPEPTPAEVMDNDVTVRIDEVKNTNEVEPQAVVDNQPPPLNSMVAREVVERVESKAEESPVKRRQSISSRRNEMRTQPEEERPLESILEEAVSVDKPPQLQPQLPTENRASGDAERRTSQTLEKVVDHEEEDDLKTRLVARKQARKRKSISESGETTPVKATRKVDASEDPIPLGEKELNITIKDLRDNMDPLLEAELLQPKIEPLDKELAIELTPTPVEKLESDRSSEVRRQAKSRRSSARTHSPAVKHDSMSSSSPGASDDSELARTRRKSILLAYSRLMSHKYSNAFQKPISNKQVPGYDNIIYNPMDLHTIKRKIDNRQITTVVEFQRDVLLMLNNAKMFNQVNSQVYNMAVEVEKDTLDHLKVTVQALGEGILRREEKSNAEKIRKRQSLDLALARKDSIKSGKRMKSIGKDDLVPLRKIKLEENEDIGETHT